MERIVVKKCAHCGGFYRGGVACPNIDAEKNAPCGYPAFTLTAKLPDSASIENLRGLGTPLKMHDTPTSVRLPPPRLGEHTRDVLSQYLDQNSIDELLNKKVIS